MLVEGSHHNIRAINVPDQHTAEDWYVFGVYMADGYNAGSGISLELQQSDYPWQLGIAKYITHTYGVGASWSCKTLSGRTYHRARHHSSLLAQHFAEHGVIPNKTTLARLPSIPTDYLPSFLLGYSDGNGCISMRIQSKLGTYGLSQSYDFSYELSAGSHEMLSDVQVALTGIGMPSGHLSRRRNENSSRLSWNSKNAEVVLGWLYTCPVTLLLGRKRERWLEWMSRWPLPKTNTRHWTEDQKQFVRDNRDVMTVEEMAEALSKSKKAIWKRLWVEDNPTKC